MGWALQNEPKTNLLFLSAAYFLKRITTAIWGKYSIEDESNLISGIEGVISACGENIRNEKRDISHFLTASE